MATSLDLRAAATPAPEKDRLTDITHSRRITRVWRSGVPCDRSAFVGSTAEDEQFDALHAQVEKVMAAAREFGISSAGRPLSGDGDNLGR